MSDPVSSLPPDEASLVLVPDQAEPTSGVVFVPDEAEAAPSAVVDLTGERATIDLTGEVPTLRRGLLHARPWQRAAKRSLDVALSAILVVLLSPVMLLIAIAIKLTSRGPVLLPQQRVGQDGEPFTLYKFRSMRNGAHERLTEIADLNEISGPAFKMRRDPRITRVGRVIRKLSLDELPQLVNVLRGEMSLVGPRPPLPEEVSRYTPYQRQRLLARPGITCIWQVSGRSELNFETWVEMDLRYIDSWTLRTDLVLILKTIPAVISGRGAF
jgi:exopolysaccharide biosynthesis polyprenyl glycosylphosphotransferase